MNALERLPGPQHIQVRYDGTLSEHLVWELTELANAERIMDLRSTVVVKTGNERPQMDTVQLGDTLAWKAFGDPREMLRRQRRAHGEMVIKDNIRTEGKAEIVINDQVLSDRIRKENTRFDEHKYTDSLNHYVSSALWQIATKEKWMTAGTVAWNHMRFAGLAALSGGMSVGSFKLGEYVLRTFPKVDSYVLAAACGLVGLHGAFTTAMGIIYWGLAIRDVKNSGIPFTKSYSDFNPMKHIGKAIDTAGYFIGQERKFVTYEPFKQ